MPRVYEVLLKIEVPGGGPVHSDPYCRHFETGIRKFENLPI